MKILEICTSQALGGLELYFLKCIEKFEGSQEISVMAYVKADSPIQNHLDKKVTCSAEIESSLIGRVKSLLGAIKTFQPDILHSHVKTDLLIIALCRLLSKTKFKHIHTRQMNFPRKKKNPFHSFVYGQIDLLIAITERLKSQIIDNTTIDPTKIELLYYGVPEPITKYTKLDSIDPEVFNVGLIARIDSKKDQHLLLQALDLLKLKGFRASAHLIGKSTDPDYKIYLDDLIKQLKLADDVVMTGYVDNPIHLMKNFDVILLTSSDETFGLVLAEAMRAGVAVVGAIGGGVPEIIENEISGLLFVPNNHESLARELEKLILDKELTNRLAKKGKEIADEKFNEGKHFESLKQLFKTVLKPDI